MKAIKLSKEELTRDIEVNFKNLSNITNNFIIEYVPEDISYFKRTLFELDRNNLNIGILINIDSDYKDIDTIINDFLQLIKGFSINLGVWINYNNKSNLELVSILKDYSDYFITGIRDMYNKIIIDLLTWNSNGHISEYGEEVIEKSSDIKYNILELDSCIKEIYESNNMKPVLFK